MNMSDKDIPKWLTKDFLEKLLENNEDPIGVRVNILKYDVVNPLQKDDNFFSIILKTDVNYIKHLTQRDISLNSTKKTSLIIKIPFESGFYFALNNGGIYEKERSAYNELLPKLNAIIKNKESCVDIFPKALKNDKSKIVILENLTAKGYKMANKTKQLDFEHVEIVLKSLAKFHAASVKLHESDPELVERFGTESLICTNMDPEVKKLFEPTLGEEHVDIIRQEFEKWPETKPFVNFLSKLKPKNWDIFFKCISPSEGEFTVLNHGDLWTNNILFKYDANLKPTSLKFIDFQILRYTSPTMDLLKFFHMCVSYEVLKPNFHVFTKIYFKNLNNNLKEYGCVRRLTWKDFKLSLEKREIFSLYQCIHALPFVLWDQSKCNDIMVNEKSPCLHFVQNETFRKACVKHLEDFSKRKWFQDFK